MVEGKRTENEGLRISVAAVIANQARVDIAGEERQ
jgi:hypothetical protein